MRNLFHRTLLTVAGILAVFALIPLSVHAGTFSDIVAFGDSLTYHDEGNVPEAYTNCPSDGPCVWVEYMATEWDADVENHAIGGARTAGPVDPVAGDIGLVSQVQRYVAANPALDPDNTLFSVWIGGNDLLNYLNQADPGDPAAMITAAMSNILGALNALENEGAEYFLVMSVPDISNSPAVAEAEKASVRSLAQAFNSALETAVDGFEAANPGITVYRFDVFTFINRLIAAGAFNNTTGTYLTLDANGQPTGGVNGPASDYLFWDLIHPTTRAHGLLGNEVAYQIEDDDDDSSSCFISTAAGHLPVLMPGWR